VKHGDAPRAPHAETRGGHPDARLRGRTYAVPFDDVWQAALQLVDGGQRGWRLVSADDQEGVIVAEAMTLLFRYIDDLTVLISLDENAQTRVDVRSASRQGRRDFGTNARRIGSFLQRLDRQVAAVQGARTHRQHGTAARR
jgi:hypothetical protein